MRLQRKLREGKRWLASRTKSRAGALLYHRVDEPTQDPFRLCVSPENFTDQMECLALSERALSVSDLQQQLTRGELDQGKVAITFDDGYLDNLEIALPILERFEIPATLFVTTGNLGQVFWWDRLAALILLAPELPTTLALPASQKTFPTGQGTRQELFDRITLELRTISPEIREEALLNWEALIEAPALSAQQRCQSETELKRFADHPLIQIGVHGVTHSRLLALPHEKQVEEIRESANTLSQITGEKVSVMSYPFGLQGRDFDSGTTEAARQAGMTHAFAADRGAITSDTDAFAIPRLWIHDWERAAFQTEVDRWI